MNKQIIFLLSLLAASFAFAGTPSTQEASTAQSKAQIATYTTISWEKAIEMSKSKAGALFLDVRNPDEVASGAVATAKNIPLPTLETRFAELPKDKDILVYCRSGHRSQMASKFLVSKGFTRIYNVDGGFLAAPPAAAFK
ncbi:MAG: rhodanese-like domain-containing protein [Fibrobacteraceae bacterium]|nr:rhodanese-like domain-containing protein [Fibrobacteraceae bacterium]